MLARRAAISAASQALGIVSRASELRSLLATASPSARESPSVARAPRLAGISAASRTSPSRGRKRRRRVPMPALDSTPRPRAEPQAGHATPRYPRFDDRKPGDRKPSSAPRREYKPRTEGDSARPPRRDFGGKPGFGAKKSFGDRPPRKEFGGKPAFKPRGDKPPSVRRTPFLRNEDDDYVPSFGLNEGGRRPRDLVKWRGRKSHTLPV